MEELTEVQKFYSNQTVFITGATGFLGKLLMEKLLRSCSDIKKMFVLVREKKGKSEEERFADIFEQECFQPLKEINSKFMEKVVLVNGNLTERDLGLSEKSMEMLIKEVNLIFHVAATVRFDQHLKSATFINARSVRDLLKMARKMPGLKSLVHVSTAYSHCTRTEIKEIFYDTPLAGENLIGVMECLDDETITNITSALLGKWPNSYVYTKAVGENILKSEGKDLPIAMVRPAIVTSSVKEPMPGWVDNMYGVNGISAGVGVGVIRTMPVKKDVNAEIVPVDFVINTMICAAWNVANPLKAIDIGEEKIPVYNYVYSNFQHLTYGKFMNECLKVGRQYPPEQAIWYMISELRPNPIHHELAIFFLHTIPAYLIDFVLLCLGKKTMAVEGYKKVRKFLDVIAYFAQNNWQFSSDNVFKLMNSLSERDREIYDFDIRKVKFEEFIHDGILGGRRYLLKNSMDTIPQSRKKMQLLKYLHYALCALLLFLVYKMASFVYNILFNCIF